MTYTRDAATVLDVTPGGDSVVGAVGTKLDAAVDDLYTDLNDLLGRLPAIYESYFSIESITNVSAGSYKTIVCDVSNVTTSSKILYLRWSSLLSSPVTVYAYPSATNKITVQLFNPTASQTSLAPDIIYFTVYNP